MSNSSFGVRVVTPFTNNLEALMAAANQYLTQPVHVSLPITLVNPSDPSFRIVRDEITVAIVEVGVRSNNGLVSIRGKVVDGSKHIKKVPVASMGNADSEALVFCNGDDITLACDTVYGDAAVLNVADAIGRYVDLDDLSSIFRRLDIVAGLPKSEGDPVDWEDFLEEDDPEPNPNPNPDDPNDPDPDDPDGED